MRRNPRNGQQVLTPQERHELIHRPFAPIRRLTTGYPWSGVLIERDTDLNAQKKRLLEGESISTMPVDDLALGDD